MNHLWQSTLFALAVWVATVALRRNGARARYWLWTMASLKFLVPLSALVAIVERVEWLDTARAPGPAVALVMEGVLAPATDVVIPQVAIFDASAEAFVGATVGGTAWLLMAVWAIGTLVVLSRWWRQWKPIGAAFREATPITLDASFGAGDLVVVSTPAMPEPGVVGIWRPRLVLPDGLVERLAQAQLRALIAHERCHVVHRDNLVAALHMVVEAIFWFHPAVWWLESRLIDERERACDEAVLRSGYRPEDYAEGILEVCRQSVGLRLACVAGVSGSNLRARVEAIMRRDIGRPLTRTGRWTLAAAIALAGGGPVAGGALLAQSRVVVAADAPRFDTVSVRSVGPMRPSGGGRGPRHFEIEANVIRAESPRLQSNDFRVGLGLPLHGLIQAAYGVLRLRVEGGPAWVTSELFVIEATATGASRPDQTIERLRSLLADRFKLVMRRETRTMPVYELARAPGGIRLAPMQPGECIPRGTPWDKIPLEGPFFMCGGGGRMTMLSQSPETRTIPRWPRVKRIEFGDINMARAIETIAGEVERPIVDRTGFTAQFNFLLDFAPASDPKASGPSLFTALEEQLGLRLVEAQAPIEMLVIESAERP
jgi:bla regulator protein blaR1